MPNANLFITTDTALDTGNAAFTDPSLVDDGALAVLNSEDASAGSVPLNGTALPAKFTIVRGGDEPQISHLEKSKINKVLTQAYRAEIRQKTAVGFNGATGALTNTAGEIATVKATRVDKGYEPFPRVTANTKVKATPYATASELAKQFNSIDKSKIYGSQTRRFLSADVLADITTTQSTDGTTAITATVSKGSKVIVTSAAIGTAAVGETLRIGSAADKNDPIYVISAISGTSITLDRPYAGASASGVALGDGPAVTVNDNAGVILEAEASEDGGPAISFRTSVDDVLVDDLITSVATPQTANGSNAMVKNLEEFTFGNRSYYMTNYFPQTPESNVANGVNYDLVTLIYKNDNDSDVVASNKYREIHLAYPQGNVTLATLKTFFES